MTYADTNISCVEIPSIKKSHTNIFSTLYTMTRRGKYLKNAFLNLQEAIKSGTFYLRST